MPGGKRMVYCRLDNAKGGTLSYFSSNQGAEAQLLGAITLQYGQVKQQGDTLTITERVAHQSAKEFWLQATSTAEATEWVDAIQAYIAQHLPSAPPLDATSGSREASVGALAAQGPGKAFPPPSQPAPMEGFLEKLGGGGVAAVFGYLERPRDQAFFDVSLHSTGKLVEWNQSSER